MRSFFRCAFLMVVVSYSSCYCMVVTKLLSCLFGIVTSCSYHYYHMTYEMNKKESSTKPPKRKILLLHGDRQTGDLLLGRISSLKRKLLKPRKYDQSDCGINLKSSEDHRIELVAPDGPFIWELDPSIHQNSNNDNSEERNAENKLMRTWWYREGNEYRGLEESLNILHALWLSDDGFEGVLGFSRGARMTHLVTMLHEMSNGELFPNLKYIISASGYGDVSIPCDFPSKSTLSQYSNLRDVESIMPLQTKSMHIMGIKDRLVPVESSRALLTSYVDPIVHEHDGGHHIPMRAADVREILKFIDLSSNRIITKDRANDLQNVPVLQKNVTPDEEHTQLQIDECESMSLIFPEEFQLLSMTEGGDTNIIPGETKYTHPITYTIGLKPPPDQLEEEDLRKLWPKNDIALKVQYTVDYPDSLPIFSLQHDMNLLEFKISQDKSCMDAVEAAAQAEMGMPYVMSCVYAAREFFEGGGLISSVDIVESNNETENEDDKIDNMSSKHLQSEELIKPSSAERIEKCKEEGLQISYSVGGYVSAPSVNSPSSNSANIDKNEHINGKGGTWKYTIGLVGKPSAGKSTFFNAGSAFARQRGGDNTDEDGVAIGGATMAPHPFTTIDPNIGYCLVPAPAGSCPEDNNNNNNNDTMFACSHGRDSCGRRLLPVMLKDVAGLVPGAYQGRGRGNKFLDDLLDADVLIHVLDASGTADTEGNTVVVEGDKSNDTTIGSNPLNDIAWVHNELIQWIVSNLRRRWDTISRRGRQKLVNMFSGYKQSEAFVWDVLLNVEKYLLSHEGRDHALDDLSSWDEGDLYRLVTAFLGVRFPICLALNKSDLPSSKLHCHNIFQALPLHGAHIGVPLSAEEEMRFVRNHIYSAIAPDSKKEETNASSPPINVWNCLQSAMKLREPVLVFPVLDMENYQPLPGMFNFATRDASLPSLGMISCLKAAGGQAPSMWDDTNKMYHSSPGDIECGQVLRDCLVMKPNSTVENVFESLKHLGALGGEFVRAEAVGNVGEKPKLVKKDELIGKHNRILKIMTTKRREWQKAINH